MNEQKLYYIVKDGNVYIAHTPLDNDEDKYEYTTDPSQAQPLTITEARAQAKKIGGTIYEVVLSYRVVK